MSDIVQPRSQGFSKFEGDQRSMFKSANGVYVSGCVHVIDKKSVVVFSEQIFFVILLCREVETGE